jgi:hypothetical protein
VSAALEIDTRAFRGSRSDRVTRVCVTVCLTSRVPVMVVSFW